jgi:transposase InsO family protein
MERQRQTFSIALMARVLRVSRSAFYAWRRPRRTNRRATKRQALDERVKAAFRAHKGRYGAPRLTSELGEQGHPYDEKTIASSLRRQGLVARAAKRFKATTNSNHDLPVAPNLLNQDFTASRANEKWVQDITYCATEEGWLYLAVVIDLYSRQVVGWAMSDRMKATLVCDALTMALFRRGFPRSVIVHSDRGSQYCSKRFQRLIEKHGLLCSMSKRGDCYDNACAESFFHSFKIELTHGTRYSTREELRREAFQYIETYYNVLRRHSALDYVSPATFEARKVA